jgi:CDP-diglyceride synthetase
MKRVLTAFLLIPAVLYVVFLAHPIVFVAAVALVAVLCYHEYHALAAAHG